MIKLQEIEGHDAAREMLARMLDNDRVPHAMLFQGPENVGKATTALAFAACLLCETRGSVACGRCDPCRLLEAGTHPDCIMLGLEAKPSSPSGRKKSAGPIAPEDLRKIITVDQIRGMAQHVGLAPRMGRHRVFLIDPADQMNAEAQNALLKTLEEPPGQAVLLLIARRPNLLLPTVRSRCFALRFAAFRSDVLTEMLVARGISRSEALARASLAEGRFGRALEMELDELQARREQVLETLEGLVASAAEAVPRIPASAAELAGKTERSLLEGLEILQGLLRDAGRAQADPSDPHLVNADLGPRLARIGGTLGPTRTAALVASVEKLRGELRFNLNRTLLAEGLLAAIGGGPLP
ncbi:MAG: DNA polymerase III subunit delta' [bacterium]|nr:DNA polymerase III subunit delta' [bacterium]